jgi:nitrogenase molybdenum-iron protein alpha chain
MGYYENKTPPVRDDRLKIGMSYGGCVGKLLDDSRSGCLLNCKRSFTQTNACQLFLTLQMAQTIPDSVTIVHGPVGCGAQSNILDFAIRSGSAARGVERKRLIWGSTNLKESDVIGGGEKKLEEAIITADAEFHPAVIFIASTCTPSIIGDDIDELVAGLQPRVNARLAPLHCPGFKTKVVASAYDTFYHSIIRHFDLEPIPYEDYVPLTGYEKDFELKKYEFDYKRANTVNLLNATSIGAPDEKEIVRLLRELDLSVNVYTEYASLDDFRLLSYGSLNISMCNVHDDYLAAYLNETYGTPFLIAGMPLGIQATEDWLLSVAKHFGREKRAGSVIAAERRELEAAIAPLKKKLKGKRVLINGGVIRVGMLAILLKELGMEVVAVRPYHFDNLSEDTFSKVAQAIPDAQINVAPNQVFELANVVQRTRPDLVIGHTMSNAWLYKLGVPSIPLFSPGRNYFSFSGVYAQARQMVKALENTAFQRNIKTHVPLPYRKEWYEKDPFFYIEEG